MNLLDLALLALLLLFFLHGIYRGFVSSALSIGAFVLSVLFAFAFFRPVSNAICGQEKLYNMMLYYTEGSEYIADVEYVRKGIDELGQAELTEIIEGSELPYPIGKELAQNIAREAFGQVNLGDYFNETMVMLFINIFAFLIVFAIMRVLCTVAIYGADYALQLPRLRRMDEFMGGVFSLVRGVLAIFLICMLLPIVLTVLPFDFISEMVEESVLVSFFYRANFLLALIPGV